MTNPLRPEPRSRMNILQHVALAFFLFASSGAADAQSLDVDTVLDQIIDSYGGEENLHKLASQVQEWDVVALMGNRHGTDVRAIRTPEQLKVVLTYPDRTETRIVNGKENYVIFSEKPGQVVTQPQRDAMRLQLMRLYSPLVLRDKSDSLTLMVEGKHCALTLFEHGVRVDYVVNIDNWRIEKVVGSLAINGAEMQFLTEYSDFTFRDGVLLHKRENKYAGGVNTAVLQLRRITLNAALEDTDFLPSEEIETNPQQEQRDII